MILLLVLSSMFAAIAFVYAIRGETHLMRVKQRLDKYEHGLTELRKEHADLLVAFDAWFDLVAPELGFKPSKRYNLYNAYSLISPRATESATTPAITVPVRVPAKLCKGKKRS